MRRGVVAARTLGLHAKEGGGHDRGLGGHGHVVLRGDAEAGWTAGGGHSLHVVCDLTIASAEEARFKRNTLDVDEGLAKIKAAAPDGVVL